MRRYVMISLMAMVALVAQAQRVVVSGIVTDERTGERLAQASIVAGDGSASVVTNDDGYFTLKTERRPESITVSHLGYRSKHVRVGESMDSSKAMKPRESGLSDDDAKSGEAETIQLRIRLKPTAIALQEVVVWTQDPRQLVDIAISKIAENYSQQTERHHCFYRESAMKRQHYVYVAEGVVDMQKTAYNRRGIGRDRVAIVKGRRLLSPKQGDTLGIKVMGGPVLPVQLDIVKNADFLLNDEELANYAFRMEPPTTIGDRLQYVVAIEPRRVMPYALYHGRLYIDRETLAFTRAELSLDMADREKATRLMLVKKPMGVRFKPKELACQVDYETSDGVTRIHYIRNTFRFNCDWRRRLFSTSFAAFCEMVVTGRDEGASQQPISGRSSFDQRDAFYDRVEYFRDPDFWQDYNIIEPTETLDNAIHKIIKRYRM